MPTNEIEYHPFLKMGEAISSDRMIIGTFPIYSLTNPRTHSKDELQFDRKDFTFFYGSRSNLFWTWFKKYVDSKIDSKSPNSILNSLINKKIAISDVIIQCSRIDFSFQDCDLRKKVWNTPLEELIEKNISKILCTSKSTSGAMGWLRDRILIPQGFTIHKAETHQLHLKLLNAIPSSNCQILPIAHVLYKEKRKISIVALPSPGSPERRLIDFGFVKGIHDTQTYLDNYLKGAFNWF